MFYTSTKPLLTLFLGLCLVVFCACEKKYKVITEADFKQFAIRDTLLQKANRIFLEVRRSKTDDLPRLILKSDQLYLFNYDCVLESDSTVLAYDTAFIIDSEGEFRKNGIWVYTTFYREGNFPFYTNGIKFSPDSIPSGWRSNLPTEEGIYFYEHKKLNRFSKVQSEEAFKAYHKNGFYFIPNKGRFFERIYCNDLD